MQGNGDGDDGDIQLHGVKARARTTKSRSAQHLRDVMARAIDLPREVVLWAAIPEDVGLAVSHRHARRKPVDRMVED